MPPGEEERGRHLLFYQCAHIIFVFSLITCFLLFRTKTIKTPRKSDVNSYHINLLDAFIPNYVLIIYKVELVVFNSEYNRM